MQTRIAIGTLILLVLAAMFWMDIYWGGYFICLVAMVLTGAAIYEFFAMARMVGVAPFRTVGIAFGVALLPYYLWSDVLPGLLGLRAFAALILAPVFALILALMVSACSRREGLGPQLKNIAVTLFGVLYVALPMTFLVQTRFLDEGWNLIVLVIAVTKASDSGAFFAGSLWGRHALVPRISPKKTVEGAIGGVFGSVIVAVIMAYAMSIRTLIDWGLPATIAFGVVVAIASQVGDLTESIIKRSVGAKDSGRMLPAFGGVLDLIDSFLVAAPIAYFVLSVFAKATDSLGKG